MARHSKQNLTEFFLGLLEGDGSIQVNHWKKRSLQYRFVIKLAYTDANYAMCAKLRDELGITNVHVRRNFVIMVEDHMEKIPAMIRLIDKHGLLLTHSRKRYAFFKYCFQNKLTYSEYAHIKTLGDDWLGFDNIKDMTSSEIMLAPHWRNWLCGFTEAGGCFSTRKNLNHSFSIAQKNGYEIMHAVKTFFNASNKIRQTSSVHCIEIYAMVVLTPMVEFYGSKDVVGLLGKKRLEWLAFKDALEAKKTKRILLKK